MSLEDAIKELTETVRGLTEVTKDLMKLRTEAIETVRGAAAPVRSTKAADKAKDEEKKAETSSEPAASTVPDSVYEELSQMVAEYLGGTDREEERDARKGKIKALLQHDMIKKPGTPADKFDTKNIKDDAIQLFRDNMKGLMDKGDLTQPASSSTSLV